LPSVRSRRILTAWRIRILRKTGQADDSAASGYALPGHTVDDLRAHGKGAEARAEFERLIYEGVESGIDPRSPVTILDTVRTEIRNRTAMRTNNTAGFPE
jgi:hypothetical protein